MAGFREFNSEKSKDGDASIGSPNWLSFISVHQTNRGTLRSSDASGRYAGGPNGPGSDGSDVQLKHELK